MAQSAPRRRRRKKLWVISLVLKEVRHRQARPAPASGETEERVGKKNSIIRLSIDRTHQPYKKRKKEGRQREKG